MKRFFLALGSGIKKFAWAIMLGVAAIFGLAMLSGVVGWAAIGITLLVLFIIGLFGFLFWKFRTQWLSIVSLLTLLLVFGIFTMQAGWMNGWWNLAVKDFTAKTAKIDNSIVGNEAVENQGVNNQQVENQNVENANVKKQTVEKQDVKEQNVDKQNVKEQYVEKQYIQKQTVTTKPQTTTPTKTPVPTTNVPEVPKTTEQPKPTEQPKAPEVPITPPVITPTATIKFAQLLPDHNDVFASVVISQPMSVNITSNFSPEVIKINDTTYHVKITVPVGSSGVVVVNVQASNSSGSYTFSNHMNY
jgi:hypothetical protein